jgi:rhamnopyranosyl-N-acetylglucosaminyl-diphospho-decaprenol beta-1,3/1,4-galactofuranosyltransferase
VLLAVRLGPGTSVSRGGAGEGAAGEGAAGEGAAGVATVVVTRNRADILRETLHAIRDQQWPPASVVVVDNASEDGTAGMLSAEFPEVGYVRLPENLGFGAGLAAGMAAAARTNPRYFWLLDDDSRPSPITLRRCLRVARSLPRFGIIGLSGGTIRWGRLQVHPYERAADGRLSDPPQLNYSDFVHLDGAVVARDAVEQVGYPRTDYFMMLEDVEYSNRLKRAGWTVAHFELDESLIDRGNLGSGGDGRPSPPWRAYYQTRNHLLMAMDHRSPLEVAGWLHRQVKFIAAAAMYLDRKRERIGLRLLGAWHGLRRVRGRTVEPRP